VSPSATTPLTRTPLRTTPLTTTLAGSYPIPAWLRAAPSREGLADATAVINTVLAAAPGTPCVHLCFGNYGGQRVQPGRMRELFPFFAALRADHVVLEAARHDVDDLKILAELDNLRFGVGVIDVKDTQIESLDVVAARIERAVGWLGSVDRIGYVHPDCGFWILPRSVADGKIAALVAGRDRYLGR
jgi:5-methyltetrahydropteroyltriglutamate--homocysteine methyltransferase